MYNKQTNHKPMFSTRGLFKLIVPLVIETFLSMTIGFVGTVMVASVGQQAVSGVSLVDNINALILVFVTALATGGAVIIAQNLGKGAVKQAQSSAKQLLYTNILVSVVLMITALIGNRLLLSAVFGDIETSVMDYAQTYFFFTALSYPFLGITNSIAATYRSMANSRTPMYVTLMMSAVNILLCGLLIYGFNMGVSGAGIAALVSRVISAAAMLILIRNAENQIYLNNLLKVSLDFSVIKNILKIGVPSGFDSGMFQFGRLIMQSLIATMGTVSIAANAVVGQFVNIITIPNVAIQMAVVTVVGQCVGAGEPKQASSYTKKMVLYSHISMATLCAFTLIAQTQLISVFNLDAEAFALTATVLSYICVLLALFQPAAFITPNALRAAGDVKFTMIISIISMWVVRISGAYILEYFFKLGLLSVWLAMSGDWFVRAVIYAIRFFSGKWKNKSTV